LLAATTASTSTTSVASSASIASTTATSISLVSRAIISLLLILGVTARSGVVVFDSPTKELEFSLLTIKIELGDVILGEVSSNIEGFISFDFVGCCKFSVEFLVREKLGLEIYAFFIFKEYFFFFSLSLVRITIIKVCHRNDKILVDAFHLLAIHIDI